MTYLDRENLTFEQAEGAAPLPGPLALGELNAKFRSFLWAIIHGWIDVCSRSGRVLGDAHIILRDYHAFHLFKPIDEFEDLPKYQKEKLKKLILSGKYYDVLGMIEFILRHPRCPSELARKLTGCINRSDVAYKVVGEGKQAKIIPAVTELEGYNLNDAISKTKNYRMEGAHTHLLRAAEELNAQNYTDSIRESIHSIESVAKQISADAKTTLDPALEKLSRYTRIHEQLKQGFKNVYRYTNDEKGIRHSLLSNEAQVDEHDALFMLGACASFVTYLINKADANGLLDENSSSDGR